MKRGKRSTPQISEKDDSTLKKKPKTIDLTSLTQKKNEDTKKVYRATTPPNIDPSIISSVNVGKVIYGAFEIQAWYYSPYPFEFGEFIERLYICDTCLRYMNKEVHLANHKALCKAKKPPGKVIYANDQVKVYEIDGHEHKFYCQNLCLLAKLFLDNKTLYYDTDGFKFYVLTERNMIYKSVDSMIGYFSKEKISYDNYNLACIMTLPSHQRRGYGRLLIELSYELSKREGKIGSPEKPLSPLGYLGYHSYWSSTIVSVLLKCRGNITIEEICRETYISEDDVINTLLSLKLLCYRKTVDGRQDICITEKLLQDTIKEFNIKIVRKIESKDIR
ncbi:acyl-CoA N-acyltransferase [Cokeromyces recurvatus]|uniref:acyl-CoA N-acyltransferase n=1 Tax=Cokeromyces recurvatus TaxID=90255 RepID=UPI0022200E75|nr:acyl-CoA N-acyltransferase [Cokeromyces recurvatus]KAI7898663.1 acyl-CoA N-acyltransferase [Cokeromyces recurvatus]